VRGGDTQEGWLAEERKEKGGADPLGRVSDEKEALGWVLGEEEDQMTM
jgi:hypothetical protein